MRDLDIGKRMNEEAILDQILDSLPLITGREITEEWEGEAEQVEGSPDFIVGFDGLPFGIELAEIRGYDDACSCSASNFTGSTAFTCGSSKR